MEADIREISQPSKEKINVAIYLILDAIMAEGMRYAEEGASVSSVMLAQDILLFQTINMLIDHYKTTQAKTLITLSQLHEEGEE